MAVEVNISHTWRPTVFDASQMAVGYISSSWYDIEL